MSIKVPKSQSGLDAIAYEARLKSLGLVAAQGAIEPDSASKVETADGRRGLDALRSVTGPDGVLTAEAAAQLQRQKSLLGGLLSRSADDASVAQTHAVRSLGLACQGLVKSLEAELATIGQLGMPSRASVDKLIARSQHLAEQVGQLRSSMAQIGAGGDGIPSGGKLQAADPKAVHELALQLGRAGGLSSELAEQLSAVRDLMWFEGDASQKDAARKALAASGRVFSDLAFLGKTLGDDAAYTLAWLQNPASEPTTPAPAPSAPPAAPARPALTPLQQAIERDFPGIHDPMYGLSQGERDAWTSGGVSGLIEYLCGPTRS